MGRFLRFRLRTLFIVTLVAATPLAWEAKKRRDEARLVFLVNRFNDAMDERSYDDAEAFAEAARSEFEEHPIAEFMLNQIHRIRWWIDEMEAASRDEMVRDAYAELDRPATVDSGR